MVDFAPSEEVAQCPSYAAALGYAGVAAAVCLSNWGSAIGTWKSGLSIVHTGIKHPASVMKNVIPIVMAGVIGIYGLIVGVILAQSINTPTNDRFNSYSTYTGLAHLCAGLCTGFSGLAAGLCIGIVGDYGIRAVGYRASQITLFPSDKEAAGYSTIPDQDEGGGGDDVSGSDDQNKLFVGMLIMLIFSEALALYGMIVALIVSQHSYSCQ
uniref:V-type proton ATPase proteolipid subunit n=1 Tax=Entomoneis paludosa TaxID=265537 RepID=A0A7S3DVW5_9STRA|mmetsp:Transcript_41040/g.85435  ORF Transcript_41040/g.85435 Transcript_41040/m.85435 type:complete len:211 (+) Transcript_41040:116-748(+)|eukprot:CAMPEP_0172439960 /NCGR_PEP_ID=MMETSP1065-20121228/788_1 /TAXON_ID=265537 /ORGANISM="Amphiprora paludosa, Strain CCMP125" /LENGTH=210 /DNA_ID=CAMNT_0013188729 /DNA_START=72 /DNA_END=704 /DNA_ORIENTATION=+